MSKHFDCFRFISYRKLGGVFVVLLCGLALAILVAILEFCWNSKKNAQTDRQSLCSEMAEELRFAVRCHGSRQRPALKRNCTKCSPGGTTYVPTSFGVTHFNGVGIFGKILLFKLNTFTFHKQQDIQYQNVGNMMPLMEIKKYDPDT